MHVAALRLDRVHSSAHRHAPDVDHPHRQIPGSTLMEKRKFIHIATVDLLKPLAIEHGSFVDVAKGTIYVFSEWPHPQHISR